ncbi:MAG: DNA alkylation repair protein [Ardenticatenaceae bacterium]|nr:DNA alkylation repair protein [Ardenticatenaceae bacterium]
MCAQAVKSRENFKELIGEIVTRLDQKADPERREWAKKNYASAMTIKGVTVPDIRPIVKEMNRRFKNAAPEEVIDFAKQLNGRRILEAQQIAIEVLEKHKSARQSLTLEDLLELGHGIDNWVSVDYFAGLLAGPAWREGQIPDEIVEKWATSKDKWWRRAAVVCTVALNQKARGGNGDPQRTLKICTLVAKDQDEMVAKGLSWALRELAKREAAPVVEFVNQYESVLPKRVIREVRRKLDTGRK